MLYERQGYLFGISASAMWDSEYFDEVYNMKGE